MLAMRLPVAGMPSSTNGVATAMQASGQAMPSQGALLRNMGWVGPRPAVRQSTDPWSNEACAAGGAMSSRCPQRPQGWTNRGPDGHVGLSTESFSASALSASNSATSSANAVSARGVMNRELSPWLDRGGSIGASARAPARPAAVPNAFGHATPSGLAPDYRGSLRANSRGARPTPASPSRAPPASPARASPQRRREPPSFLAPAASQGGASCGCTMSPGSLRSPVTAPVVSRFISAPSASAPPAEKGPLAEVSSRVLGGVATPTSGIPLGSRALTQLDSLRMRSLSPSLLSRRQDTLASGNCSAGVSALGASLNPDKLNSVLQGVADADRAAGSCELRPPNSAVGPAPPSITEPLLSRTSSERRAQSEGFATEAASAVPESLAPGIEVALGEHTVRIIDALGRGSYSVVWRGEVISSSSSMHHGQEVAVKDVLCRSNNLLRQSLFEVQLLLALEQMPADDAAVQPLRLPRCLSYKVDASAEGWHVRTAMERLPGEQLDDWLRRAADVAVGPLEGGAPAAWSSWLERACMMSSRLIQQIGPTLHRLAPLAWHRDVNSHNILISDGVTGDFLDPAASTEDALARASFWLVDLGLAVDSRSWVSEDGAWRRTDISGDCRYWPVSSWQMHLFGADYLTSRPEYCQQYQTRLDIHGLGITCVELLCATAHSARLSNEHDGADVEEGEQQWGRLLDTWHRYRETVDGWWAEIYSVFSTGGDFGPVHAWLLQEEASEQVIQLMADLREALYACMQPAGPRCARVLQILAELIDENSSIELLDAAAFLSGEAAPLEGPGVESSIVEDNGSAGSTGGTPPTTSYRVPSAVAGGPAEATGCMASLSPHTGELVTACASVLQRMPLTSGAASPIPGVGCPGGLAQQPVDWKPWLRPTSRTRKAELAKLVEAQAQLRRDLERLQLAKLRLEYARKVHQERLVHQANGQSLQSPQGDGAGFLPAGAV